MVTFAQAQERAERWINGDVPAYQSREIRVREFDLGFVVWSEPREDGPSSDDGGDVRVIVARDSGEATLWPGLPIGELIRRYEEEYGPVPNDAVPEPPQRIDLEATSFLLSPPQWLQDAADKMGIPDRRTGRTNGAGLAVAEAAAAGSAASDSAAESGSDDRVDAVPGDGGARSDRAPDDDGGYGLAAAAGPRADSGSGSGSGGIDYRRPAPAEEREGAAPPASGGIDYRRPSAAPAAPAASAGGWAGKTTSDSGEGQSVAVPATVFAPPISGSDQVDLAQDPVAEEARTELLPGGSSLPRTRIAPPVEPQAPAPPARPGIPHTVGGSAFPPPGGPAVPLPAPGGRQPAAYQGPGAQQGQPPAYQAPGAQPGAYPPPGAQPGQGPGPVPPAPGAQAGPRQGPPPGQSQRQSHGSGAADIADLETAKAVRGSVPPPAATPVRSPDAPPPPPGPVGQVGGYLPTQMVPQNPQPPAAGGGGDPHYAATMLAGPGGPPGPPGPTGPTGPPPPPAGPGLSAPPPPPANSDPHYAATMLAGPSGPPAPQPGPGGNDPHYAATMLAGPSGPVGGRGGQGGQGGPPPPPPPAAYGYPQPVNVPTVGPGYMAVLRYRGQDGSEQQLIRRSAPGTPHPEWQILHELRSLGVRPEQVLELHTELEPCDLPGGYCTRMIRETWPQVRISHTAPYGRDHASRRQGVQHLLTHQGELHQVAGAPARPQPQRVPMPDPHAVQRVPPVPLDVIGQELAGAFGPQGLFRFDQRAVSRQGVPEIVAQTLVWAGLPVDFGPFFWAQAQPGQPVPTLAELAQQRGVQPASDAGSYLVMGNDFGRQLCVQYGTAHIVAVPLEAGPGGQPAAPQFVNSSLPEFARCLALLGRMWRLRIGLTPDQAGRWTVDFQAQLAAQDPAAIASPDHWWSVLIEQMWDGLL